MIDVPRLVEDFAQRPQPVDGVVSRSRLRHCEEIGEPVSVEHEQATEA